MVCLSARKLVSSNPSKIVPIQYFQGFSEDTPNRLRSAIRAIVTFGVSGKSHEFRHKSW